MAEVLARTIPTSALYAVPGRTSAWFEEVYRRIGQLVGRAGNGCDAGAKIGVTGRGQTIGVAGRGQTIGVAGGRFPVALRRGKDAGAGMHACGMALDVPSGAFAHAGKLTQGRPLIHAAANRQTLAGECGTKWFEQRQRLDRT